MCLTLTAGDYFFNHRIQNPLIYGAREFEGEVHLFAASLPEQLATLFNTLNLNANGGFCMNHKELRMHSYLIPNVQDAREFRKILSGTASRKNNYFDGFSPDFDSRVGNALWTHRDTSFCGSWLIELVCDDDTVARERNGLR